MISIGAFAVAVTSLVLLGACESEASSLASLFDELTFRLPSNGGFENVSSPIARALSKTVARSVPSIAASPGATWEAMDDGLWFKKRLDLLGQLFLEQAGSLGAHVANVSLSYSHVDISQFEGHDLDHLSDTDLIEGQFRIPKLHVGLRTEQILVNTTYGISRDIDVNLALPILVSRLHLDQTIRFANLGTGQPRDSERSANATADGVGDLLLRGKYHAGQWLHADWATGLELRLPSGNADDFQGTGAVEVSPAVYVSMPQLPIGVGDVAFRPYMNVAVDIDTDDVSGSEARWGVGLDAQLWPTLVVGAAFLARDGFSRIAPKGFFDRERFDQKTGRITTAPLFGLDGDREDILDLALGGRWAVWGERIILFGNVLIPLNQDGFRAEVIPIVGLEVPLVPGSQEPATP